MDETLWVCNIGAIDYNSALTLQESLRLARQQDQIPDTLLLLEHTPAVYTRGRRSAPGELTMGEAWYAEQGIDIIQTKRGGKVTYHGPGQLVGYGIVRVDDVVGYVRLLEEAMVDALHSEWIQSRGRPEDGPDYTGVWVENRKIASIGVHVSQGVTAHGFAVNVENDMRPFQWVVACGLPEVTMTSVAAEQDESEPTAPGVAHEGAVEITSAQATTTERFVRFRTAMASAFARHLGRTPELVEPDRATQIAARFPFSSGDAGAGGASDAGDAGAGGASGAGDTAGGGASDARKDEEHEPPGESSLAVTSK